MEQHLVKNIPFVYKWVIMLFLPNIIKYTFTLQMLLGFPYIAK